VRRRGDMREIEFRGKSYRTNKWVYGYFIKDDAGQSFIHAEGMIGKSSVAVNPKAVGQYTGLKDIAGGRIFEGDIVKIDNGVDEEAIIGFVVYEYVSWQIDCGPDFISLWRHLDELKECQSVEIIGDIYDAPELLKGGEG
jgi:uncharacterized phage protein (TIGR01671 family)